MQSLRVRLAQSGHMSFTEMCGCLAIPGVRPSVSGVTFNLRARRKSGHAAETLLSFDFPFCPCRRCCHGCGSLGDPAVRQGVCPAPSRHCAGDGRPARHADWCLRYSTKSVRGRAGPGGKDRTPVSRQRDPPGVRVFQSMVPMPGYGGPSRARTCLRATASQLLLRRSSKRERADGSLAGMADALPDRSTTRVGNASGEHHRAYVRRAAQRRIGDLDNRY